MRRSDASIDYLHCIPEFGADEGLARSLLLLLHQVQRDYGRAVSAEQVGDVLLMQSRGWVGSYSSVKSMEVPQGAR